MGRCMGWASLSELVDCGNMQGKGSESKLSDNTVSGQFPTGKREALALLYVQSQDLSGKTPEDLAEMYTSAYKKISEKLKALRSDSNWLK